MNVTPNTNNVDTPAIEVVRHYYIDADGNEVEIPFDPTDDAFLAAHAGDGEATQTEATITEDHSAHPVTVH